MKTLENITRREFVKYTTLCIIPFLGSCIEVSNEAEHSSSVSEELKKNAASYIPNYRVLYELFENDMHIIYVSNYDGSNKIRISDSQKLFGSVVLGPDKKTISFTRWADGNFDLFTIGIDGKNQRQITNNGNNAYVHWLPNGQIIWSRVDKSPADIYITNGDHIQNLTKDNNINGEAIPSPDGKSIIYESIGYEKMPWRMIVTGYSIVRINPDGTGRKVLLHSQDDRLCVLGYSPDGKLISYIIDGGDESGLYVSDPEFRKGKCISRDLCILLRYQWSPNSQYIVFEAYPRSDSHLLKQYLYLYDIKKDETIRITQERAYHPRWFPDNEHIYFITSEGDFDSRKEFSVVIKRDGTGLKNLTENDGRWFGDVKVIFW